MNAQFPSSKRRLSVDVTANKTLTASDSGTIQNVVADGVTVTLPASATAVIRSSGVPKTDGPAGTGDNKSQAIIVSGTVSGLGATGAGTFTLAKASQEVEDELVIVNGVLLHVVGAWVRS